MGKGRLVRRRADSRKTMPEYDDPLKEKKRGEGDDKTRVSFYSGKDATPFGPSCRDMEKASGRGQTTCCDVSIQRSIPCRRVLYKSRGHNELRRGKARERLKGDA